jgi:Ser/Thr protein kinase RdoA (MazF antagonist)
VTDTALVGRLLRVYHRHGVPPAVVRRLGGSAAGQEVSYLVAPGPGRGGQAPQAALVVRACRADAPVPVQFRGPFSATPLDWLLGRAATLEYLAAAGYPAPRLVPTHSGDPVGLDGVWLTLATSYLPGRPLRPTLPELRLLGEALGRLHALPVPGAGGPVPGPGAGGPEPGTGRPAPGHAAWDPVAAIPMTLDRLDRVAGLVPPDWRDLHGLFRETVLAVQRRLAELPRGLVHGDAWPGNAVQNVPGQLTLVDWETGGVGLPVLDLGYGLIESLLDVPGGAAGAGDLQPPDTAPPAAVASATTEFPATESPATGSAAAGSAAAGSAAAPGTAAAGTAAAGTAAPSWLVQPDPDRIAAVASGYTAQRVLTSAEGDLLLPAIRFAAAYLGAIHFEQTLLDGVRGPSMDARLTRLRNRLDVSAAVARLATPWLAGPAGRQAR